jgi:hypothetical protein
MMVKMTHFFKMMVATVLCFFLTGCEEKPVSYLYLLKHPAVIQSKLTQCEISNEVDCPVVKRAAADYMTMNTQRQESPEEFGTKILLAQQGLVKARLELEAAQNDLSAHPEDAKLQKKLATLKDDYQMQFDKVNALLAIVSATSPE